MSAQAEYSYHKPVERTWTTPAAFTFADGLPVALQYQQQHFSLQSIADDLPPYALFIEQGEDSGFSPYGFMLWQQFKTLAQEKHILRVKNTFYSAQKDAMRLDGYTRASIDIPPPELAESLAEIAEKEFAQVIKTVENKTNHIQYHSIVMPDTGIAF